MKTVIIKNTNFRMTSKLWTKAGQTNGGEGVIHYIIYDGQSEDEIDTQDALHHSWLRIEYSQAAGKHIRLAKPECMRKGVCCRTPACQLHVWTKTFQGLSCLPFPNYERFLYISMSSMLIRRKDDEERLKQIEHQTVENIAMPIRWIMKSSEFRISIHVRP